MIRLALMMAVTGLSPALADAPLMVLDRTQLPFDLGPGHPANNPARAANAPHAAWNSAGNTANAPSTPGNRPTDRANAGRVIFTSDGTVVGYYAPNAGGVLNLFDVAGQRIAYRPARGTKSLFTVQGTWCGTVDGLRDGSLALAVTPDCARLFLR